MGLEITLDPVLKEKAYIVFPYIAGGILFFGEILEELLTGALSRHNHGMTPRPDPFFECRQKAFLTLKVKVLLRDEHEIDIPGSKGGIRCNESGVPAHHLDEPDAIQAPPWPPHGRSG